MTTEPKPDPIPTSVFFLLLVLVFAAAALGYRFGAHRPIVRTVVAVANQEAFSAGARGEDTSILANFVDSRSSVEPFQVQYRLYNRLTTGECYAQRLQVNGADVYRQLCPDFQSVGAEWVAPGWDKEQVHVCVLEVMSMAFGPQQGRSADARLLNLLRETCRQSAGNTRNPEEEEKAGKL